MFQKPKYDEKIDILLKQALGNSQYNQQCNTIIQFSNSYVYTGHNEDLWTGRGPGHFDIAQATGEGHIKLTVIILALGLFISCPSALYVSNYTFYFIEPKLIMTIGAFCFGM